MVRDPYKGVRWQAQIEGKWLAELLANKKSTKPLLKILQTTEIGGREEAKERKLEWKQVKICLDKFGQTQEGITQKSQPLDMDAKPGCIMYVRRDLNLS